MKRATVPVAAWLFEAVWLTLAAICSLVRGIDYLRTTDESVSKTLGVAVQIMPIDSWGWMFILSTVALVAGLVLKSHLVLVVGCSFSAVAWGCIAVTQGIEVARIGDPLWRTPFDAFAVAVLFALLTGIHMVAYKADQEREKVHRG